MEPLGTKLRRQRRRLGFTLDELAGKTSISKPYLSLIETGRVKSPPSDEKLRRLEQVLGFATGELLSQAHLQRTPRDVRAMLQALVKGEGVKTRRHDGTKGAADNAAVNGAAHGAANGAALSTTLDDAYLSGVLRELVDRSAGNVEQVVTNAVPVINRVSAGYPKDFTDMSYPRGIADDYVGCPDVQDRDAFAARVSGDSMTPKYREGDIVIFSPAAAPRDGDDCFVRFADGQTTFKRVFFETGDSAKPVVRLQPRNEKYRPQVVPGDAISGLYRAVYRYQRVDQD
jgi:phage repressor protein C with HTH and peptisase S24 domain